MGRSAFPQAFGRAMFAAAVLSGVAPALAMAEDDLGTVLSFDVEQQVKTRSNPGLKTPAADRETLSLTRFGIGLVSATQTQRLSFTAGGTVEAGKGRTKGLADPHAEFDYRRESAAAALTFNAFLREKSVDALDFVLAGGGGGGAIVTSVTGTGTQRRFGGTVGLELGRDAPFGAEVTVGLTKTEYSDTTDPSLIDNRRETAKARFRFDLNSALSLNAGLAVSHRTDAAGASDDIRTLSFGLSDQRPDGEVTIDAAFVDTNTGNRQELTFGRARDLPSGELAFRLGLARGETGDVNVIGGVDWQQDLERGQIALALDRSVTSNDNDVETRVSRLSLSVEQELSSRLTGGIDLGLQDSRETLTGTSSRTAELTASLKYDLTSDWGLSVGATHRDRHHSISGDARTTDAFLSVSRHFKYRP